MINFCKIFILCFFVFGWISHHVFGGQGGSKTQNFDENLTLLKCKFEVIEKKVGNLVFVDAIVFNNAQKVKKIIEENSKTVVDTLLNIPSRDIRHISFFQTQGHVHGVAVPPLLLAVYYNRCKIIDQLLAADADVHASARIDHCFRGIPNANPLKYDMKFTALVAAANNGSINIVKKLFNARDFFLEHTQTQNDINHALYYAALNGHINVVSFLLTTPNVNVYYFAVMYCKGQTIWLASTVYSALFNGHMEVVKLLINDKDDVNEYYHVQGICSDMHKAIQNNFHQWQILHSLFVAVVVSVHAASILKFLDDNETISEKILPKNQEEIAYAMCMAVWKKQEVVVAWMLKKWPASANWMSRVFFQEPRNISPLSAMLDYADNGEKFQNKKKERANIAYLLLTEDANIYTPSQWVSMASEEYWTPYSYAKGMLNANKIVGEDSFLCACRTNNVVMIYDHMIKCISCVSEAELGGLNNPCSIMNLSSSVFNKQNLIAFCIDVLFFPLFIVAEYGSAKILDWFLRCNADIHAGVKLRREVRWMFDPHVVENIYTPLVVASFLGREEMVSALLAHHQILDNYDAYLFALCAAIQKKHRNIVKQLLNDSFFTALKKEKKTVCCDPLLPGTTYNVVEELKSIGLDEEALKLIRFDEDDLESIDVEEELESIDVEEELESIDVEEELESIDIEDTAN